MKENKVFLVLIILFYTFYVCQKDKNVPPQMSIKIEGFYLRDFGGNPLTQMGLADSDWYFVNSLSSKEMALFDFDIDLSYENTFVPDSIFSIIAFPNPVPSNQTYSTYASDSIIMKVIIVNEQFQVLKTESFKFKSQISFVINFSDRIQFPDKSSYRIYYSLSAKNHSDFKFGYGDIKICDDPFHNCF